MSFQVTYGTKLLASTFSSFSLYGNSFCRFFSTARIVSGFNHDKSQVMSESANRRLNCIAYHCTSATINPANLTEKALANGTTCPPPTPGLLRLYNMRFCPFAQRTRLVLEHKNIPHEIVNINLKNKADWFLKKNPQGLVPILELDGHIIYESTATCEWLDDVYPGNRLQPDDPNRKAWDRMLLEYFGNLSANVIHRILRRPEQRESLIKKTKDQFHFYENVILRRGGPYFGGAKIAMIDFYLWPHMERIPPLALLVPEIAITSEDYPHLTNWFKCMYDRPEVKVTMMDNSSHLHFLRSLAEGQPDYDYGLAQ